MGTLNLRDLPDDVVDYLKLLAKEAGLSVSEMAVRALAASTSRALNPSVLGTLPDLGIRADDVLAALGEGRAERY